MTLTLVIVVAASSTSPLAIGRVGAPAISLATAAASAPRQQTLETGDSDGPVVRVGLMSDVASVSLSSDSGVAIRRGSESSGELLQTASGQLRIEVRRPEPVASAGQREEIGSTGHKLYQVEVTSAADARAVRRISEDLKTKFYETVSAPFDSEAGRYRILLGRFAEKEEAAALVDRLRRAGYVGAKIAGEQARSSYTAKSVRSEAVPRPSEAVRKEPFPSSPRTHLAALVAGNLVAVSYEVLVVAPRSEPLRPSKADLQARATRRGQARPLESGADVSDTAVERGSTGRATSSPAGSIRVEGREYRGEIRLVLNTRGRINVINALPLEQYLRGVVPMELPPSTYPQPEALKAQAVAARSYALAHTGGFSNEGFDLHDDARSQVYGGLGAEHPLSNRAIEETRGIVVVHSDAGPIDAVYTASCGGQTEDNESVFLTRPLPYLRSVVCVPDTPVPARPKEINTSWPFEPIAGWYGRPDARDVALLEVFGFELPSRVTGRYLAATAGENELRLWVSRLARAAIPRPAVNQPGGVSSTRQVEAPTNHAGNIDRIPVFASALAEVIYGAGRAASLMSPSSAEYILLGLISDDLPRELRPPLAVLLREGVFRLPIGPVTLRTPLTRALAIEALSNALSLKPEISRLRSETADSIQGGRLRTAGPSASSAVLEIDRHARLFRRLGDASYPVSRLAIVGGEKIVYHRNSSGRIDFLEVEPSARPAAGIAEQWRKRLTIDEIGRKFDRSSGKLGEIVDLLPAAYGRSGRVLELEVIGRGGRTRLRGFGISSTLGLKENTFAIEREHDNRGRLTALTFIGRGVGHGVGLCQTGAYGLARQGYSYTRILQTYYTGAATKKVY